MTEYKELLQALVNGKFNNVEPESRSEAYLMALIKKGVGGSGGDDVEKIIQALTVTENGTYEAPEGVDGYSPVVVEVASAGGGDDVLNALIDRSITEISSNATSIGSNAFNSCSNLTAVNFPVATRITDYAFGYCSKLTTVNFPAVTSIGSYAFNYCSQLTAVNFPMATSIGSNAFSSCSNLTTADFPVATSIGDYVFGYCSKLTTVNFPVATRIGNRMFNSCFQLTTVNFPVATSISDYAFYSCSQLTTVNFPAVTSIGTYAFRACSQLTAADFPVVTRIGSSAFYSCSQLTTLVLRSETMTTMTSDAFSETPIESGTGYIYVPSALIEQYKVDTYWSNYAAQFRAIEDYSVDGTLTGEIDPDKPQLITFNINEYVMEFDETTTYPYTATSGMTWGEWVNSEYSAGDYYIEENIVYSLSLGKNIVVDETMENVTADMVIDPNTTYVCIS